MKYEIRCPKCGETFWIRGSYDPSVSALELNDNDREWDEVCLHIKRTGDYDLTGEESCDDED